MLKSSKSTTWDDKQKKDSLWDSISWELKDRLVGKSLEDLTFHEFANLLARTSDDIEAVNKAKKSVIRSGYQGRRSPSPQTDERSTRSMTTTTQSINHRNRPREIAPRLVSIESP